MRLAHAIFLGLLPLAFSLAHAAGDTPSEPTKNFILPTFTPEGYRSMLMHGSEARMLTLRLIQLDEMNLTVFSGDASNRIDSILLSPLAIISLDNDTAHGPGAVRLIRDDLDLTGEQWTYDHANKKISIARNVRVVFNTELKDMLK
ncbi:MAG TPA: hypothetical protein VK785_06440 [Opitutaceae bacterium]|jgi:hypothetical protein|nr:hypothetical protein [Opitutaceae bacterium]